jgi:chemotaxis signal transduction protein
VTIDSEQATARVGAAGGVEARVRPGAPDEPGDDGTARPTDAGVRASRAPRTCLFSLGDEVFAVDVGHARRVVVLDECTPVPGAPSHLVGIANLGGAIVPVVDIRPLLALRPGRVGPGTYALLVAAPPYQVAVAIEKPLGLGPPGEDIPAGEAASPARAALGRGFVPWEGGRATVLDVPRILHALRMRPGQGRAADGGASAGGVGG